MHIKNIKSSQMTRNKKFIGVVIDFLIVISYQKPVTGE